MPDNKYVLLLTDARFFGTTHTVADPKRATKWDSYAGANEAVSRIRAGLLVSSESPGAKLVDEDPIVLLSRASNPDPYTIAAVDKARAAESAYGLMETLVVQVRNQLTDAQALAHRFRVERDDLARKLAARR